MIYYEVRNKRGRILASNFSECPPLIVDLTKEREKDNFWLEKKDIRHAFREDNNGEVRLIILEDKDLGNSAKGISRICAVYLGLIPRFSDIEKSQRQHFDQIIDRFAHNLVDLNKELKGNLEKLAPDSTREKSYKDFVDSVKTKLLDNPQSAANDICKIAHSATNLEAQITGLRVISGLADEIEPSLININIQRMLFRLQQPFVNKINIENNINTNDASQRKVCIDPQLFNLALSQVFSNAIKYIYPETPLNIMADFEGEKCILKISMESRYVDPDEVEKIFEEKYKGRHVKDVEGNGIGLFLARQALRKMNGDIKIKPQYDTTQIIDTKKYSFNVFEINVPLKKN